MPLRTLNQFLIGHVSATAMRVDLRNIRVMYCTDELMSDFITGQDRTAKWRKLGYCYHVDPLVEGGQDDYERNVNHVGRVK